MRRHAPLTSASCPELATASRQTFGNVPPARPNLGEAVRMSPSLVKIQRAMSASRQHRPKTATGLQGRAESRTDALVLDPLPPPCLENTPMEQEMEEELHREAHLKLLAQRLRLMEENGRPVSAPAGSLPEQGARQKLGRSLVGGLRRRRRSPDRRRRQSPEEGRLHRPYSGTWGELNPFDPVQNPKAHLLLQQRAKSDSPQRPPRTESLTRDLESFRPSFRTEWLVALRQELLLGTQQENAKLRKNFDKAINAAVSELTEAYDAAVQAVRKDYADAAADIRHDFIDCFINGDIGGMIEAANKKRRIVDVDFCPVFEEIDKIKQHVSASEAEVLEAISALRKDQASLREETSRLVIDLTDSVSVDAQKSAVHIDQTLMSVSAAIEDIRHSTGKADVDLTPVLHAIKQIEDVDLTPMFGALQAARESEIKIQADLCSFAQNVEKDLGNLGDMMNAIKAVQHTTLAELEQMSTKADADCFVLLNAVAGTGLDVSGQLEELDERLQSMTGDIKHVGDSSLKAVSDQQIVLSNISKEITSSGKEIQQVVKASGEEKVTVDFSPVVAALAKLDLEAVIESIDASCSNTRKHIDKSIKPVSMAVGALDLSAAVSPVLESVSRVSDVAAQISTQQGLMHATLTETHAHAREIVATMPPSTDLTPVLTAIGTIDVQPQVQIDLQSVLNAVDAVSESASADYHKLAIASEAAHNDVQNLAVALAKNDSDSEERSRAVMHDLTALKDDINRTSGESVAHISRATSDAFTDFVQRLTAKRAEGVQELLDAIAAIDIPQLNLDPVLDAIVALDSSSVMSRIDTTHMAMLTAIREVSAELASSLQRNASESNAALERGFNGLHGLDGRSLSLQKAMLEIVTRIDSKPAVNLDPLHDLVTKIDSKAPVDLQPVLDAVLGIEINPVVHVDTRPVIDAMSAGLARIEIAWAQVDLTELTRLVKKLDTRLLEAIVKMNAKGSAPSTNVMWDYEANKFI